AAIGQVVTYTIAFTVPAGHVAYQPTVTDTLPRLVTGAGLSTTPALTYVVGSGSPSPLAVSPDGGGITWTLPTVTATCGAPAVVTVTFGAQVQNLPDNGAGDLLTNTVTLSYTESTANGPAHLVTTTRTASLVEPAPAITKGMTPDADLGSLDTLTVTVTLTNTGTGHLYDVVVTDTLPTGLAFLDATPGHSVNGQDVTWTVDSLVVGQQQVFTITARVAETIGANEMLINEVEVHGTSRPGLVDEERAYTDTAQAIAATGYPDLVIGKERGPAVRSPGQPITYIIVYTNTGVVRAENVRITDTLPALLTDVISATSAEATVDHVGQAIIWTLTAPVSRTVTGTIWLTATVSPAAQEGATLTNTVTIAATTTEQNTGNNTALVTTAIHLPSLHITKTVEPAAVLPGDLLTYTLTVSNTWLGEATGLLISDTVPSNTSYQSCSGGDSCSESGGVVIWTVAALPAGEQVQVSFTVRVGADVKYGTSIVNQTYAVSCIQGVTAEGAPVSIPVGLVGGVVLEPDRTGSGLPGEAVVYHHVLTNTANVAQTIGLDASSSEGWQVNVSPTSVPLAAGAHTPIVVTVTVGSDAISVTVDATVVTATGSLIGFDIATDRTTVGCVPVSGADFTY
nr:DUF11 domain-containing protein [Anaerolineae bacterium]